LWPQTLGTPLPPHVSRPEHVPHWSKPPHPSATGPQFAPTLAHVFGTQPLLPPHLLGAPPASPVPPPHVSGAVHVPH